jgi:hypothetical protein
VANEGTLDVTDSIALDAADSGAASYAAVYADAGVPVRGDLRDSHAAILQHLGSPGCWFTGAERLAIAAESRAAETCGLCADRKAALSPEHASGSHVHVSELPDALVEIAHRIRMDSGRLSRAWFDQHRNAGGDSGTDSGRYVEAIGVIALLAGLDAFCSAAGIPRFPLPEALPGEPSGYRPDNLTEGIAWVPIVTPGNAAAPEADLYPEGVMIPNIVQALSLVPDHVRILKRENDSHYIPLVDMTNPTVGRDLDRLQIELVAARVSALNECFY